MPEEIKPAEPEAPEATKEDKTPSEKFLETVEGDLFSDIVTRACVLDVILKKKILTKGQLAKIIKLRPAIERAEKVAMPVAIGACVLALDDLDPVFGETPNQDELEGDATRAAVNFLEKQEKRKLVRSEKLGPLSYPLF